MRILIVEDEKKYLDILLRSLKGEGYTADGVGTAADAVEYLKSYHYDLVIMDLQLPGMNGVDFLKTLRAEPGGRSPVVVLCTVENERERMVEAIEAGADEYVMKPFDSAILESKLALAGLLQ